MIDHDQGRYGSAATPFHTFQIRAQIKKLEGDPDIILHKAQDIMKTVGTQNLIS